VELLKQTNYNPYPIEEQTVSVWAGTEGKLDDIPVADVRRFETDFLQSLRHSHRGTLDAIKDGQWDDDIVAALDDAIAKFKRGFLTADGTPVINEAPAEAMAAGVEGTETVKRVVPKKK